MDMITWAMSCTGQLASIEADDEVDGEESEEGSRLTSTGLGTAALSPSALATCMLTTGNPYTSCEGWGKDQKWSELRVEAC